MMLRWDSVEGKRIVTTSVTCIVIGNYISFKNDQSKVIELYFVDAQHFRSKQDISK